MKNEVTKNSVCQIKFELLHINGQMNDLSNKALIREFFRCPLLTFKVIFLIHYQALKIVIKRIKYVPKPPQKELKVTKAQYIKNN